MKAIYTKFCIITGMVSAIAFTNITYANGNERICEPMVAKSEIYVNFPNGAFSIAGDYGSNRITTRYDNDRHQGVLYTGRTTNALGGGGTDIHKLCYIDQAKGVGAPSTLIMVFGEHDNCGSWYSWAQVQSSVVYSGCEVNGNTVTLK
jgi:hypothetical protein